MVSWFSQIFQRGLGLLPEQVDQWVRVADRSQSTHVEVIENLDSTVWHFYNQDKAICPNIDAE
jgi:hypothetical protein